MVEDKQYVVTEEELDELEWRSVATNAPKYEVGQWVKRLRSKTPIEPSEDAKQIVADFIKSLTDDDDFLVIQDWCGGYSSNKDVPMQPLLDRLATTLLQKLSQQKTIDCYSKDGELINEHSSTDKVKECKLCKAQRKVYEFNFDEKLRRIKELKAENKELMDYIAKINARKLTLR